MARIAIVEDAPDNAEFFRIVLEAGGHTVTCFPSGWDFLANAELNTFNLILLDISMPDLDGYETLELIRKGSSKIPVIAVTAHAFPSQIEEGLRKGFSAYIVKPILDTNVFLDQISRFLQKSDQRKDS
jgi:CheY-like chemotaxis protein